MRLQHKRLTDRSLSRVVVSVRAPRVALYLNIGVKKQGLKPASLLLTEHLTADIRPELLDDVVQRGGFDL